MVKRVQVTLSDDEFAALAELAALRGESMSRVLGGEVEAYGMYGLWCEEIKARANAEAQRMRVEESLQRKVQRARSRSR